MRFKLKADVEFEAENIDAAFTKLADYFEALEAGVADISIFDGGNISIDPITPCKPAPDTE